MQNNQQHTDEEIRPEKLHSRDLLDPQPASLSENWVPETRFGKWFLSTDIWVQYVLGEALDTLVGLLDCNIPEGTRLLEVGCGQGRAFALLDNAFTPHSIVGVDIDLKLIERARTAAEARRCEIRCIHASATCLPLPSESVDLVFCHQLLHHMQAQQTALREFHRVLIPGGRLLIAESCRSFIESSIVRTLFRHPMAEQKTADEYLAMVRSSGFDVPDSAVAMSSPWWSLPDFGLRERLGLHRADSVEATEVLLVAHKVENQCTPPL